MSRRGRARRHQPDSHPHPCSACRPPSPRQPSPCFHLEPRFHLERGRCDAVWIAVLGYRHRKRDAALNTAIHTAPNLSESLDGHRSFKLEPLFLRLELYQPALLSAYPAR